jgi:beta-lactamase regulating signal transducer with metallopeptidase domain/peroxiredoxin
MHPSAILIIEVILKGTAIVLVGYGGATLLARSSAAHRSWWWLGVFATLLLLPLAFLVRPLWTLPVPAEVLPAGLPSANSVAASRLAVSSLDAPVVDANIAEAPVVTTPRVVRPPARAHFSLGPWLFGGYACGAFLVLGFRLLGTWELWKLRRGSVADPEGQTVIDHWRQTLGLRREVRVYCDARVTVPMTWGVGRPVILLPDQRSARTAGELQAALQHEFAHIRHHDAARRWLGTIVAALWWPHPLVWLASRAWKLEQERACDDAVLTSGSDAASYAQQLLEAARSARLSGSQSAAALIMATPAGLETRLRSVMSEKVDRSPTHRGALLRIGALTVLATLCGLAFQARSVVAAPPAAPAGTGASAIQEKAEETIIPKFEYYETTPAVVLQAISNAMGVRISYVPRPDDRANLTLVLTNVPAAEVLKYVAQLAYLKVTYQADGIAVLAERVPTGAPGLLEKKAEGIVMPKLTFKNATSAEVLKALSEASGIKVVYTPAEWDQPNQTFTYYEGAPASSLFYQFAQRAHLYMTYREDAIYFVANPYARNGFKTPGTVEYTAEMTTIPMIDWKGIKPAEAFKGIAAASGIKIFYTPRPTDKPGLPEKLSNASVAFLVGIVAEPAGLRISYEADGIHLAPGDPNLNWEHSQARLRAGLPAHRDLLLEASPEFKAAIKQRLDGENAFMQEKYKKATLVNVGDPAPDFTCRTVSGEELTLSKMKDKVIVLHFVSSPWCWDAAQKFEQEALQKYTGRTDIQLLTIITSNVQPSRLEELVKQRKVSSPTAGDPQKEIFSKYASGYGRTYIIGKDGKIKQCLFPFLVQGKAGYEFDSTAFVQAIAQGLQKELAVNP